MQKAVIFYTDGTSHKLSMPSVTFEKFTELIELNVNGYKDKTVDHIARWIER